MRRKSWLTMIMLVVAAGAIAMAVTSYKEIDKKIAMQGEDQQTMLVAGLELQTEETETDADQAAKKKKKTSKAENTETQTEETETASETQTESETANPEAPVIELANKKVEIKAGDEFEPVYQVKEITDDKDDRSSLFRQIEVSGEYSTTKAGTYTLTYIVTDSDGNSSAPAKLELVVKG